MATITPVAGSNAGAVVAEGATAPGGDAFTYTGKPLFIVFTNGHTVDITVNVPAVATPQTKEGVGAFTVPARSLVVTANGGVGVFEFNPKNVGAYLNASGQIAVTYTGHNAALKQRALVSGA